ncbi:hypothetical protein MCAP1_002376 [Malassezia caprae]|uniref:Vacuolar protein sorting-associated protein VTA1 n=1 Tax=Malassezia caprae TaxID=1381934 RepID=A0AAF0ECP8_9BASI|nr:hypothetical protein MCAP1_002376 [Malassezia caprae]
MPSPVPPVLKEIAPFLQRAKEVEHADPVMAYWCKYYAAQLGIEKGTGHTEAQAFLLPLMDELEQVCLQTLTQLKATLSENEAVTNDAIGQTYIENFALQVFLGADNEDREGKASRYSFLAASKFLELLKVFGPLEADIQTKVKYAKWKAAQISKALREGTELTPGPDKATMETEAGQTTSEDASQAPADDTDKLQWPQVPHETDAPRVQVMTARPEDQTPKPRAEAPPPAAQPLDPEDKPESGLSVSKIAHIQKLCRWTSSALDYEDLETARTQLHEALLLLDTARPST